MICLRRPSKVSKWHDYLPLIVQVPLDLLDHAAQTREHLTQQPGPNEEISVILSPTLRHFGASWIKVTHPNDIYIASKIQRSSLGITPFFGGEDRL